MAEKVTKMLIKVDLQCSKCYRKIKKVLCRFPQIRDQIYDEKNNAVLITVVCCSPEKIKEKICCKARKIILGIEIIPDKLKPTDNRKKHEETQQTELLDKSKDSEKHKETETSKKPPTPEIRYPPPGYLPVYPAVCWCQPCYMGCGPCHCGPPPMCSDGCGRAVCECQGGSGSRGHYVSPCNYLSEENASGCTVM